MQQVCKKLLLLGVVSMMASTTMAAPKVAAKPSTKPASKPTAKPAGKPASKPADKPADKPAVKPTDKPAVKTVAAKPAAQAAAKPSAKAPKKPAIKAPQIPQAPKSETPEAKTEAKAPSPAKPQKPALNKAQTLAKVTSDRDSNISRLVAILNDDASVEGIRFDTKHFEATPSFTTSKSFNMDDIASARGVVLLNASGYDAVMLKARVDSKSGKGAIEVRFLTNALFSSYSTCRALVLRDPEGNWRIINEFSNKPVDDLFVQSHSTGITTIRGICQ